jgi:type IV pilus assembly protein PilM
MFQFQKSRNGDNPIQNVVFYGDTTEFIRLTNSLEQMDISTSLLGVPNNIGGYENFEFQAYANAIGAMLRSNKESERINLLEVDAAVGRSSAGASFIATVAVAAVVSIALVGGITLGGNIIKSQYESDTAEIQEWLDSPETAQRTAAVDAAQAKIDKVENFRSGVVKAKEIFDTRPVFTTEVKKEIEDNFSGTKAEILTYSFESGAISLSCKATDSNAPSQVVENFIKQDIFENVTYTGFEGTAVEGSTSSEYTFSISMSMKVPETEEDTADEGVE